MQSASGNPHSGIADRLRHRLIPAVPVIFTQRGDVDQEANARYAAWMARQDVGAVAVWAHTGRGLRLDDEQRDGVLRAWVGALGGVPVVCGVGVAGGPEPPDDPAKRTVAAIERTVRLARQARAGGAAAVMVHPPVALRDLPAAADRIVELHQAVATVGLPVIAFYLYEAAGGIAYAPDTVERILAPDGVIGIKLATLDGVLTFQDLVPVVRNEPRALLITGEDRFLGYSLILGADAALVGVGAACTDVTAQLLARWFAHDLEGFLRSAAAVDGFARATFHEPMEGYVQRMAWALEADGVIGPGACDPFAPPLDSAEQGIVAAAVMGLRLR